MTRTRRILAWGLMGVLVLTSALAVVDITYASSRGPALVASVASQQVESRGISPALVGLLVVVVVTLGIGAALWVRGRRRAPPGK